MIRSQDSIYLTYSRILVIFLHFILICHSDLSIHLSDCQVLTGVMHEADDASLIRSTWACYWLDQFLTLALSTWISSKLSALYWICLLFILLILVGVQLPLCIVVTLPQNAITCFWSQIECKIVLFYLCSSDRQYHLSLSHAKG